MNVLEKDRRGLEQAGSRDCTPLSLLGLVRNKERYFCGCTSNQGSTVLHFEYN